MLSALSSKERIQHAILKHAEKDLPKESRGPRKKRGAPEKEVQREVVKTLRQRGFSIDVVENEAVQRALRGGADYLDKSAPTRLGFSDLAGNDAYGRAVFIELKAKGRVKNLTYNQLSFLLEKIETNCFATVADEAEIVLDLYERWSATANATKRRRILIQALPDRQNNNDDGDLF